MGWGQSDQVTSGCGFESPARSRVFLDSTESVSSIRLSLKYHSQGRLTEATKLGPQVMELRKNILGPESHRKLTSMGNLASIYLDEHSVKAEELLLEVLAIRMIVLGLEHHHSLTSIEQLPGLFRNQWRSKESEDLEAQVEEAQNNAGSWTGSA